MNVGVLGTGDVGKALANGFLAEGHAVMMGSRTADNAGLVDWVASAGDQAKGGTFSEAAAFADLVVLATKGAVNEAVIGAAGPDNFVGKVLIDATNPLDFSGGGPALAELPEGSGGAQVQALAPEAKVVKAFNTIGNPYMYKPDLPGGPPTMFIAGDDDGAKAQVKEILTGFGFPETVDAGGIKASHYLEAMCMVWVAMWGATGNGDHAFKMIHK